MKEALYPETAKPPILSSFFVYKVHLEHIIQSEKRRLKS